MLDVVSGSVAAIMSHATIVLADLWVLIALAIGIPVAFYFVKRMIGFFVK